MKHQSVSPPDLAGPVDEAVIARAAKFVPILEERAERTEKLRRLPDETVSELGDAGLLNLLWPRKHGGGQVSLRTAFGALYELAKGCGSTAWVAGVYGGMPALTRILSDAALEEIYSSQNPKTIGVFGTVSSDTQAINGGYRLSGRWSFASGQHHAGWACMFAPTTRPDGSPDVGVFMIPRDRFELVDDWHVSGFSGTGSNTLVINDEFVPIHRVAFVRDMITGAAQPSDPYYNIPPSVVSALATAVPLGMARRTLDIFSERMHKRGITYTPYKCQAEATITHLQLAEATMLFEEAEFRIERILSTICQAKQTGPDPLAMIRCQVDSSRAFDLCRRSVTIVQQMSGSHAIQLSSPIQRHFRDICAISTHARQAASTNAELYGRFLSGQDIMAFVGL